ncbi:MAG: hypothetical protein ACYCO0_00625 [Candidatus Micrarchaeaceae archaeon]
MSDKTEAGNNAFSILVVSDINGGKRYMDVDGLIGLAHMLREMPENKKPNMFVIDGGILPEIPTKGGPRNEDKQRVLIDGVENLSGAAAVIEPHMERLFSSLSPATGIVYVMGASDQNNIENIRNYYNSLYSSAKATIKKNGESNIFAFSKKEIESGIKSLGEMLRGMKEGIRLLEEQLASASGQDEKDRISIDIKKTKANLKLSRERLLELEEKRALLGKLEELIKTEVSPDDWQKLIDSTNRQLAAITTKRGKLNRVKSGKETEEQKSKRKEKDMQLLKEAKILSNKLKQLQHRLKESIERNVTDDRNARMGDIHRFTGRIPVPKGVNDIIDKIVRIEYMTHVKDAFGRKRDITIQEEAIDIYKKSIGSFGFSVILADSMSLQASSSSYRRSSNAELPRSVYKYLENSGKSIDVESADLAVTIGGGHGFSSFTIEPLKDQSKILNVVAGQGPFLNVAEATALANRGIKTRETVGSQQGILTSSASIIEVGSDGSVSHITIMPGALRDARIESDREEAGALAAKIAMVKEGKGITIGAEDPGLSKAIFDAFRPSEVPINYIAFADENRLRSLVPYVDAEAPQAPKKVCITDFGDTHVGGYGDIELLKAAVADALKRRPDIIILNGDLLEGNLKNHKFEARPENEYGIIDGFKAYLAGKGLGELDMLRIVEDRRAKQDMNMIINIDAQSKVFMDIMAPLIIDGLERGAEIYIDNGNHYTGTVEDSQHDEATVLDGAVKLLGMGMGDRLPEGWESHIRTVRGGKYTADTFNIDGMNVEVRHALAARPEGMIAAEGRKMSDSAAIFHAHYHNPNYVYDGQVFVEGLAMQDTGPHERTIGIPLGYGDKIKGYVVYTMEERDGKILRDTFAPMLRDQLVRSDGNALWKEFLSERKSVRLKVQA